MTDRYTSDLLELRESSARHLPDLEQGVAAARARRLRASRLWRMSSLIGATATIGLLLVPISYNGLVGYDVVLQVSGAADSSLVKTVSREIQAVLGAREVALGHGPADALRFAVSVPARAGVDVERRAQALAQALERQGHLARATVTPRRERVSGTLYAFARDHVIRVRGEGRTALQLEAEIRRRLAEDGLTGAQVSVVDEPGQRRIQVETPRDGSGDAGTLGIGLSGATGGAAAPGTRIEVTRTTNPGEGVILHVHVTSPGRSASIQVPHSDAMSPATLAREVESRLKAAGLDARATVAGGSLQIELNR
jgi:hypothetical protein